MNHRALVLFGLLAFVPAGVAQTNAPPQGQPAGARPQARELTSYRDVVKQVLPAVVSIEVKTRAVSRPKAAPRRQPGADDSRIPDELRRFLEESDRRRGDLDDVPSQGIGSGVIVDPKGVVLTNYHVVAGADQVEVSLGDGRRFLSREIKGDRKTDLAIVRITPSVPLPALELGDSDAMEIGDRVLAVGAPFGLAGSVTHGIVSGKGRNLNMNMYEDFVQTDAAINPGNSGGPLVNLEGKVIGINTAIKTRNGGSQGVGLAIASNLARNIMQQLQKDGVVRRGYLGVQIRDLSQDLAERLEIPNRAGVLVAGILETTPAGKAGIREGDVIIAVAGKPVRDGKELQRLVAVLPLRQAANVTVVRDGKSVVIPVTIEEQPEEYGTSRIPALAVPRGAATASVKVEKLGLEVAELTAELAEQFGYREGTQGVLVARVDPNGPAAESPLRRGMLLVRVDRKPVPTVATLREVVEKASLRSGILFQVTTPAGGVDLFLLREAQQ